VRPETEVQKSCRFPAPLSTLGDGQVNKKYLVPTWPGLETWGKSPAPQHWLVGEGTRKAGQISGT
jgi:hypothetical protein